MTARGFVILRRREWAVSVWLLELQVADSIS